MMSSGSELVAEQSAVVHRLKAFKYSQEVIQRHLSLLALPLDQLALLPPQLRCQFDPSGLLNRPLMLVPKLWMMDLVVLVVAESIRVPRTSPVERVCDAAKSSRGARGVRERKQGSQRAVLKLYWS